MNRKNAQLEKLIFDQAHHIANVAQALADGRIASQGEVLNPRRAAALGIISNAQTMLAWIEQAEALEAAQS